jgi:peptidoglycan/xylan/chitin deacetylase (PgdA/CDA1 family)
MPPLVLAYHAVAHELRPGLLGEMVVTTSALAAEVERLRAHGRRFVTAGELCDDPADDVAVLSFDDGWADALTIAAPLLVQLGVRATFYVCPGLFGNTEDGGMSPEGRVLTREEAAALAATGMELGAHSMHHPDLTSVDDVTLAAELELSRAAVETITGAPCRTFAYPFGLHDARVRAATEAAGFELGFQFTTGPWQRFAAPRVPKPAY